MMETIALYFTPLPSTKIVAAFGFGLAYHIGIVYTNDAGQSFGATSGPSKIQPRQTPMLALEAIMASRANRPSQFGTLIADPNNNRAFIKGRPEDYFTQSDLGDAYPHVVVARGRNLSAAWGKIVTSYKEIGKLRLTYSPISQNSNSMAGTALRRAGIKIPFSSETRFAPAAFNNLRAFKRDP